MGKKTAARVAASLDAAKIASPSLAEPAARRPHDPAPVDTSKLAHELRTPIGAIMALSEIMRDERLGPLPERYRDYAAHVYDSALHTLNVLSAALDTRHSSLLSAPLNPAPVAVDAIVGQLVASLAPLANRHAVRLGMTLEAPRVSVLVDERALRQMLLNLISNAIRFTPPGGHVEIKTAASGRCVRIAVTDDGDGMTATRLAKARAATTTALPGRGSSGGSGYGLPIVQALAAMSGAGFALDSTPGRGTTAMLEFPQRG
jgi:signal transduction histidine kinase